MDRIKGSIPAPTLRPTDGKERADGQPQQPIPAGGRLVAAGGSLSASQREQNRQLIALYHAMRDIETGKQARQAAAGSAKSTIKGWNKRSTRKSPARPGSGIPRAGDAPEDGTDSDRDDGNDDEASRQHDRRWQAAPDD